MNTKCFIEMTNITITITITIPVSVSVKKAQIKASILNADFQSRQILLFVTLMQHYLHPFVPPPHVILI